MDTNGSGLAAALWVTVGAAIWAGIQWIAARLVVPRDAVQRKFQQDMRKDLDRALGVIGKQDSKIAHQGAEIAYLRGLMEGQSND